MSDKEIINGSSGKWTLCLWRIRTCRHRQREEGNDAYTYWHWGYILFTAKWSFWGYHSLHVMNNKRGPPLTLLLSQFKDDDSFVLVQSCQKGDIYFNTNYICDVSIPISRLFIVDYSCQWVRCVNHKDWHIEHTITRLILDKLCIIKWNRKS